MAIITIIAMMANLPEQCAHAGARPMRGFVFKHAAIVSTAELRGKARPLGGKRGSRDSRAGCGHRNGRGAREGSTSGGAEV